MIRRPALLLLAAILAGCIAEPGPSSAPGPSAAPSVPSTGSASPLPNGPLATLPPGPSASASGGPTLPDGIEQVAWWRVSLEQDASGEVSGDHVAAGLLGQPASFERSTRRSDGYLRIWGAGSLIAVTMTRSRSTTIEFRDLVANRKLATYELDTPGVEDVIVDPQRGVAYATVLRVGGGVDLRRLSVTETDSETLVGLDERFTPDGMAVDRYTMTTDPDGVLLFEACADRDGCRVWELSPGRPARNPTTLPTGTPKVCSAIGAGRVWLVVYDLDACFADTGDAPMPIRAISRVDGSSHVLDGMHLLARRVVELDGETLVVASERSSDWSTSDIVTIEVVSRAHQWHARSLPNLHDGSEGWLGVSPTSLPGSWVLVEPWGVEPGGTTDGIVPSARLLDLATDELLELAPATFGWR